MYQRGFRDGQHPVFDGVIKLRFIKDHPASQALKDSVDRVLKVSPDKASDWKPGRKEGQQIIRYCVARHHYTEKHIQKYLADPKGFSFLKPFSVHGAKKYLHFVDPNDTFQMPGGEGQEPLYLQCPNVPKEEVKAEYNRVKGITDDQHVGDAEEQPVRASQAAAASAQAAPQQHVGDKKDSLTVSTTRSSSQHQQLRHKEEENKKLKDELEMMKSQLTFLHDMVRKLQEEHFGQNQAAGDHMSVKSGRSCRSRSVSNRQQRGSGRSARSGVPREINLGEDEEGGEGAWDQRGDDWTEYQDDQTENVSRQYDEEDDETFQQSSNGGGGRGMSRRYSNGTQASRGATSIVSLSKSIKTLPRELELDEDDSDSHESLNEEAFDNRSFASTVHSRSAHSRGASSRNRRYGNDNADERPGNAMSAESGGNGDNKRPARRGSNGEQSQRSTRSSRSAAGTYEASAMSVTDPYGEKGTYTGSISHSTGMPHGFGRLEYDRAGRWYEGDWKHGRWTGHGRLSNGDGDFYEGGLKNDHKHGHGMMRFADGRTFEGEYINGQMVEGRMTYQDGSTYSGFWVEGMRHGRGKCIFTDESVYEGEFREGEFCGQGKMAWSDGGWYQGEWWNGEMHGKGKEVRPDGTVRHDGEWCKGQPIRH